MTAKKDCRLGSATLGGCFFICLVVFRLITLVLCQCLFWRKTKLLAQQTGKGLIFAQAVFFFLSFFSYSSPAGQCSSFFFMIPQFFYFFGNVFSCRPFFPRAYLIAWLGSFWHMTVLSNTTNLVSILAREKHNTLLLPLWKDGLTPGRWSEDWRLANNTRKMSSFQTLIYFPPCRDGPLATTNP